MHSQFTHNYESLSESYLPGWVYIYNVFLSAADVAPEDSASSTNIDCALCHTLLGIVTLNGRRIQKQLMKDH